MPRGISEIKIGYVFGLHVFVKAVSVGATFSGKGQCEQWKELLQRTRAINQILQEESQCRAANSTE